MNSSFQCNSNPPGRHPPMTEFVVKTAGVPITFIFADFTAVFSRFVFLTCCLVFLCPGTPITHTEWVTLCSSLGLLHCDFKLVLWFFCFLFVCLFMRRTKHTPNTHTHTHTNVGEWTIGRSRQTCQPFVCLVFFLLTFAGGASISGTGFVSLSFSFVFLLLFSLITLDLAPGVPINNHVRNGKQDSILT